MNTMHHISILSKIKQKKEGILVPWFKQNVPKKTITHPNTFTGIGYALLPLFHYTMLLNTLFGYIVSFFIFVISAIIDLVDGPIARAHNRETTWGKWLDHIRDKLLIGLASYHLFWEHYPFLVSVVIGIDIVSLGVKLLKKIFKFSTCSTEYGQWKMTFLAISISITYVVGAHMGHYLVWTLGVPFGILSIISQIFYRQ